MEIKVLEDFKHPGYDPFYKNNQRTVNRKDGELFCEMGWAEDVSGETPTGERDIHKVKHLEVDNAVVDNNTQEA